MDIQVLYARSPHREKIKDDRSFNIRRFYLIQ